MLFGGAERVLDRAETTPAFHEKRLAKLRALLEASLPALGRVGLDTSWSGPTSVTRHGAPVVQVHPQHSSIVLCAGFQAFACALLAGAMVRGLVLGPAHVDDEVERLRRAWASTRVPWLRGTGTLLGALGRSLMGAP